MENEDQEELIASRLPGRLSRSSLSEARSSQLSNSFSGVSNLSPFDINAQVGKVLFDKYLIQDVVGQGGMAVVYRAKRLSDGVGVAVKTLRFGDSALMARFMREVKIHSQLKHENIVEPLEFNSTEDGQAYFVMELLKGRSIEDLLVTRGRFNKTQELIEIIPRVCDALSFAHDLGIIHRDIKPANIILSIVDGGKKVDVVDFGLAKLHEDLQKITKTGQVLGSPIYMSPEQCRGDILDPRSDVYSLAVVMYEMVTGALPFDANTPVAMMESHCNPKLIPVAIQDRTPDYPFAKQLNLIVRVSMETEPDKRYQSIGAFREAFDAWQKLVLDGSDGGFFEQQFYQKYLREDNNMGLVVDNPIGATDSKEKSLLDSTPSTFTPRAFAISSRSESPDLEEKNSINSLAKSSSPSSQKSKLDLESIQEIPLASEKLRNLVIGELGHGNRDHSLNRQYGGENNFVADKPPPDARFGDIVVKVILFLLVLGAFSGGTIFFCIKFLAQ